jgi:hypothetical protein
MLPLGCFPLWGREEVTLIISEKLAAQGFLIKP